LEQKKIILLSCGLFDKDFLKRIAKAAEVVYGYPVITEECHLELSPFYNPARRQYDGDRLLHSLPQRTKPGCTKVVGLFRIDLYIPILTYIFGQAILGKESAIVSIYRLRNELYGLKPEEELLLSRTTKEVIHELGHTFGLIHCNTLTCVMHSSTYVEEIDLKGSALCNSCRAQIRDMTILP
jgi:archaemetzincin